MKTGCASEFKRVFFALVAAGVMLSAQAAQTNVSIVNFAFSPTTVAINVNDSVVWTWNSDGIGHSTTNTMGLWFSGVQIAPFMFTNQFNSAGSFPYYCTVHPTIMTNNFVNVSGVTPVPVVLTNLKRLSPTQFRFTYSANTGLTYIIQRSPSPLTLTNIATNIANGSSVNFTDNTAAADWNFYRVGRVAGP